MLSRACDGLLLGRDGLWLTSSVLREGKATFAATRWQPFADPQPVPDVRSLAGAIDALGLSSSPRRRLQIALPDAATRCGRLRFRQFPRTAQAQQALLAMRFEEAHGWPAGEQRISWQLLQRDAEGLEVFAVAVRSSWLEPLQVALQQCGQLASVIDAVDCFRFSMLRPWLLPNGAGALLSVGRSGWSLLCWSAERGLTGSWVRTHDSQRADAPESLAGEAARWLRANWRPDESPHELLLVVDDGLPVAAYETALSLRLKLPIKPLPDALQRVLEMTGGSFAASSVAVAR